MAAPHQSRHQRELEQHRKHREREHQWCLREHGGGVEPHAHGDEEQPEQHVVKRPDVGLDLVLELGLGDQHASDERAQRKREPGVLGEPGETERDEQQVQHEQLFALPAHHQREPPAHGRAATDEQHRQQHDRLDAGDGQLA